MTVLPKQKPIFILFETNTKNKSFLFMSDLFENISGFPIND
jgi:hypothetical protein